MGLADITSTAGVDSRKDIKPELLEIILMNWHVHQLEDGY